MDLYLWYISAALFAALVVGTGLYTAFVWNQHPDARRGMWLRHLRMAPGEVVLREGSRRRNWRRY